MLGFFLIAFPSSLFSEINSPIFKQIVCSVNVGNKNAEELSLELADNEQKRSYGLMNRKRNFKTAKYLEKNFKYLQNFVDTASFSNHVRFVIKNK